MSSAHHRTGSGTLSGKELSFIADHKSMNHLLKATSLLTALLLILPPAFVSAQDDNYYRHYESELKAKENRLNDVTNQVQVLKTQLDDERRLARESRERLFKEYMNTLETEREQIRAKLGSIEQRKELFEAELDRKSQEDDLRLLEKERSLQSSLSEIERLRMTIEEDKQVLNDYQRRLKETRQADNDKSKEPRFDDGSVNLEADSIRISGMTGREIMGYDPIRKNVMQQEYFIEYGDVLQIDVWRVPDLSRSVTVRPDGKISLPLAGDINAVGVTLTQLRDLIREKVAEYVIDPQVTISVSQFGGRKFVILGQINAPGVYRFQQSISLLEAIALSGGFREDAKSGEILIIRGDIRKQPKVKVISVDMTKVWKEGVISENLTVLADDIIYVGKTYLADYNKAIDDLVSPLIENLIDFFVLRSAIRTAQQKGP